jgi:predicted DNA-binding transcriptional regulator YafY
LTAQELHAVVERDCSLRTIYRDVAHLQQAGFPIVEDDGTWKIVPNLPGGIASEPVSQAEALAILMSEALWEPLGSFGPARTLSDLRKRLEAHLTAAGRNLIDDLARCVRTTVARPALLHEHVEILDTIQDSADKEQLLEIEYATPQKAAAARVVEPHLVWLRPGRAYLVAFCRTSNEFRPFAIQRIRSARMLDEVFERRSDFDARAFIERSFGVFQGPSHDIVVEFSPSVAHLARETQWHPTAVVDDLPNGSARLSFHAAGLPEIAAWIAGFGGKVVPRTPVELVDRVSALHREGLSSMSDSAAPQWP